MLLGDRLRAGREYLGLSQKDIAAKAGVSIASWQGYERNSSLPGGKVLESLCKLGFYGNWLLTGEGPMHRDQEGDANRRVSEPDPLWGRTVREDHEGREYFVTTYEPDVKSPAPPRNELSPAQESEDLDIADQWGLKEEEILALFEEFWAGLPVDLKELVAEEVLENNDFFARWVKKRIRRRNKDTTQSIAVNE